MIQPERALWERRFTLHMRGGPVDQIERYFLARLSSRRPAVTNSSSEPIQELRWWSLAELQATDERIYPEGFVELLPNILIEATQHWHAIKLPLAPDGGPQE